MLLHHRFILLYMFIKYENHWNKPWKKKQYIILFCCWFVFFVVFFFYILTIFFFTDDVVVAISNSGAVKVWTLTGSENMVGISTVIIHLRVYTTAWKPVWGTQVDFYITWSSLRFVISWSNDILSFNALITEINGHIVKGKHF